MMQPSFFWFQNVSRQIWRRVFSLPHWRHMTRGGTMAVCTLIAALFSAACQSSPVSSCGIGTPAPPPVHLAVDNSMAYLESMGVLYGLDARTGTQRWVVRASFGTDDLLVQDSVVLAWSGSGLLTAFRGTDGKRLWSFRGDRPVIVNHAVYLRGAGDSLVALQLATGNLLWRVDNGGSVRASVQGIVYTSGATQVNALQASTGKLLWTFSMTSVAPALNNLPLAIAGNTVVVNSGLGFYGLRLRDGKLLWRRAAGSTAPDMATGSQGVVYVSADSKLFALRASDGAPIWSYSQGGPFNSLVTANDQVYTFSSSEDIFYAFRAVDGRVSWHLPTQYNLLVGTHLVYLWLDAHYAYDLGAVQASDGRLRWRTSAPGLQPGMETNGVLYLRGSASSSCVNATPASLAVGAIQTSSGKFLWHRQYAV